MIKKRILIFAFLFLLLPTLSFAVKELDADRDGKIDSSLLPIDTTTTLGTSDVKVPSQNAVKTYADTKAPINNPTFTGTVKGVISGTTDNCVKIGADGTVVDNGSACGGGTMVYPSLGIAVSTGSSWGTPATSSTVTALFSGSGDYLKSDGTKGTPPGAGDFVGPASSTNNNFVKFGDTTGKLGADSGYSYTSFVLSSLATDKGIFTASGSATPTFTALGAVTDGVFGVSSSALGFYTTMQLDDSAPQIKHADDTQTFKIDLQYLTSGDAPSIAPIGNYEFKYTLTGNTDITVPTSGTLSTLAGAETFANKTLTRPAVTFDEVDGHTDSTSLTAANLSRTVINSYGRSGAATLTLPAAAEGYTAIFIVGTQHNSAWKIQRAGSDTITWSAGGTDTVGKTYFQETNQPVGSRVSCITYQTGASVWSWLCGSVTGTWATD